jgi:hypothetical protein
MTPVAWMAVSTTVSWMVVAGVSGAGYPAFWGLLGPLAAAIGTWVAADRTFARAPEQLTALMIAGFAGKMVFFGAYVAVMLTVVALEPVPFVVSFTIYYIALHLMEALFLRRLFAGGRGAPR